MSFICRYDTEDGILLLLAQFEARAVKEFLEKDLQVHAYKINIILCSSLVQWDHACASNFTFHDGTKF